jgi:FlaA1/EpsC-like NDP-sugar epimerase
MAKHKPNPQQLPHLFKYIKVYAAIVATACALLVVFRAHCLNSSLLLVVFFAAAIPISFALSVAIIGVLYKHFSENRLTGSFASLVPVLSFLVVILVLFETNDLYCTTLLKRNCKVVSGVMLKRKIRRTRHNSWPVLVYRYNYNGTEYYDQIDEEDTNYHVGDTIQLRVSTFDATVNKVLP